MGVQGWELPVWGYKDGWINSLGCRDGGTNVEGAAREPTEVGSTGGRVQGAGGTVSPPDWLLPTGAAGRNLSVMLRRSWHHRLGRLITILLQCF